MLKKICDWSEGIPISGEFFPEDKLCREKYANHLSNFLISKGFDSTRDSGQQKFNYVLNLNSEWGSGKSYFLKRWKHDLEKHYPVVYIDAWQQDYSDDPLMTVVSSLIKQLRELAGKGEDDPVFKAPRKLVGLLKSAAPYIASSLTKRYLGIDPAKIMEASDEDEAILTDITDDNGQPIDMGPVASSLVKHLISKHDAKSTAITDLKTNIEQWVEAAIAYRDLEYPAFVFIDELDRCRPSYAVEMLETIKHIFDIKGVVFVVATDTEQLQHAVKVIYGDGFDARVYLTRFFNSRYTLKQASFESLFEVHCDVEKLDGEYFLKRNIRAVPASFDVELDSTIKRLANLTMIYNCFELSARQGIQITDRLISALDSLKVKNKAPVSIIYLAFLLSLKEKSPYLYDVMMNRSMDYDVKGQSLMKSIDSICNWQNNQSAVFFHLNPKTVAGSFIINPTTTTQNKWEEQWYRATLKEIIIQTHIHVLDSTKSNRSSIDDSLNTLRKEQDYNDKRMQSNFGSQWFNVQFGNANRKGFNINFYKDLVELSSALDWLDEPTV